MGLIIRGRPFTRPSRWAGSVGVGPYGRPPSFSRSGSAGGGLGGGWLTPPPLDQGLSGGWGSDRERPTVAPFPWGVRSRLRLPHPHYPPNPPPPHDPNPSSGVLKRSCSGRCSLDPCRQIHLRMILDHASDLRLQRLYQLFVCSWWGLGCASDLRFCVAAVLPIMPLTCANALPYTRM